MSRKCPLPTNREVEAFRQANATNTPSPTDEDRELIEMDRAVSKLVDLHKRLHGCFTSPTGVALPRRPRNLEPTMADCNATLAGMVELERAKARLESLLSDRAKLEERVNFIKKVFADRMEVYRTKRDKAEPFSEDTMNNHDALGLIVEAFEYLEHDAALNRSTDHTP